MFTQQELQALLAFLGRAQITGQEAMTLAVLQQKVNSLIKPEEKPKEKPVVSKK